MWGTLTSYITATLSKYRGTKQGNIERLGKVNKRANYLIHGAAAQLP
jgi:hypothetical protein